MTLAIYRLSGEGPFSKDYGLREQTRRAVVSIEANIAEGFGRGGNREFSQFLAYARGSSMELHSHITLANTLRYVSNEDAASLLEANDHLLRAITKLIRTLSTTKSRGPRFCD